MKNKLQKWMEKKEQLTRDFEQLRVKAIKRKIYPYWAHIQGSLLFF